MENGTECLEPSRGAIRQTVEADYSIQRENQLISFEFKWDTCYSSHQDSMIKYYTQEERAQLLSQICSYLFNAAADADSHLGGLERVFSGLVSCQWRPDSGVEVVVDRVEAILRRLPHTPGPIPGVLEKLPSGYFMNGRKTWNYLHVTTLIHKNLIRCAILSVLTATGNGTFDWDMQEGLNIVGELIQLCVTRSTKDDAHQHIRFLVVSYLWSFWQRARLLQSQGILAKYLRIGYVHGNEKYQWMRNFQVARNLSIRALTEEVAKSHKPLNMCGWKFELLRGDSKCLGFDFRSLFTRFKEAFGSLPASCLKHSTEACDGRDWHDCLRFDRTETGNQTMHDASHPHTHEGEPRVKWDEESYRGVVGARAVSIYATSNRLTYCTASERTLAFSHVWSHGQGGRPHEGINRCLHQRYANLAKSLGCDSYWIDSACIPDEDELRKEAINHINGVFYRSKYVLVCDRELMTLDANNLITEHYERILTGVLLSDWNIRAWTMLEALKGREHVAILCRDDHIVSFSEVAQHVCDHGRLAVAGFLLLLPHMLHSQLEGTELGKVQREISPNDIPLETIGSWLSHRPASRKGDDVRIWSLCLNQHRTRVKDAVDFWRQQKGVYSGFLLSSSDRLVEPGLSWAPASPFALSEERSDGSSQAIFHRPLESADTQGLSITSDGLWGAWWVYEHDDHVVAQIRETLTRLPKTNKELRRIRRHLRLQNKWMALLRPVSSSVYSRYDGVEKTPSVTKTGTLVAVCDSSKTESRRREFPTSQKSYKWIWCGVYEWPTTTPMPEFTQISELWIG
ncbi:hypothetical protein F5B17DRAFT_38888 [Nemania serpens]|nr:hypothetical protein F5B17DRAFT_38888 [Nemania serpens]